MRRFKRFYQDARPLFVALAIAVLLVLALLGLLVLVVGLPSN